MLNEEQPTPFEKLGLNFAQHSIENLRHLNAEDCMEILSTLDNPRPRAYDIYLLGLSLEAQTNQNWILMRQNEEIIRLLKEIAEK